MGQHTKQFTPSTYGGSGWSNPTHALSDNTTNYAHTSSKKVYNGSEDFLTGWSASKISDEIPSYATLNSATVQIIVRVHDSGSGKIENIKYVYDFNNSTPSTYPYTISENGFGTSWTTVAFSLKGNVNLLTSSGLVVYAEYTNRAAKVQYIDLATIKLLVAYTVPDITYTYKDWDGTTLKTQTVEQGTSPTAPSNPTRDADAEYTYTFSGWSLSGYVYTAQYTATKRSYTVTANTDGNGTATGGGSYEYGESATLTATPNSGYKFKQWSDGSTENPRTVTVTGAAAYTAEFEAVSGCGCAYIGSTPLTVKAYVGTTKVRMFVGTTEII